MGRNPTALPSDWIDAYNGWAWAAITERSPSSEVSTVPPVNPVMKNQVGVNDVRRSGGPEQGSDAVRLVAGECDDVAAAQEASELGLPS